MKKPIKEKQMIKVTTVKGEEYKGMVLEVQDDTVKIVTSELSFVFITNSSIQTISSTRFPKELSDMLKELYSKNKDVQKAKSELEKQQELVEQKRKAVYATIEQMQNLEEELKNKRFDLFGSLQDLANKLKKEIEKVNADCIYSAGMSSRCVRLNQVYIHGKKINMEVGFEDTLYGEDIDELYWQDYEQYYDCVDWDAFQKKYCPNVLTLVKTTFPFAKVVEKERSNGNGDEKRKVEVETIFTISFNLDKDGFNDKLKEIIVSLQSLKTSYVLKNERRQRNILSMFTGY